MKRLTVFLLVLLFASSLMFANGSSEQASDVKEVVIGVFEPQTGENGGGGYQEVLGMRYANEVYPTVQINGETFDFRLV